MVRIEEEGQVDKKPRAGGPQHCKIRPKRKTCNLIKTSFTGVIETLHRRTVSQLMNGRQFSVEMNVLNFLNVLTVSLVRRKFTTIKRWL